MKKLLLKELNEYIPKCIICKKDMYIFIKGNIQSRKHVFTGKKISIKTKIEQGHMMSGNKDYPFIIRMSDSEILEGQEFFSNLFKNWTYVNKRCSTCDFIIGTIQNGDYGEPMFPTSNIFPSMKLSKEKVSYTMPGGKNVTIEKKYYDPATFLNEHIKIEINNKPLPPFPFEFAAVNGLKQLNTRLLTIRTFQ